ncbi:MAG: hypothetical protein AAF936_18565 [Pseudomonadota bacterium]
MRHASSLAAGEDEIMGAVTTLVATVAAAAGAVALYRFVDRQTREFKDALRDKTKRSSDMIIDYERDPESGVYKPKH